MLLVVAARRRRTECRAVPGSRDVAASATPAAAAVRAARQPRFCATQTSSERPLLRPLGSDVVVVLVRFARRAVRTPRRDVRRRNRSRAADRSAPVWEVELDLAACRATRRGSSRVAVARAVRRRRPSSMHKSCERRVAEEDETAARPQQARRFRNPPLRIGPDRRAVLGERPGRTTRRARARPLPIASTSGNSTPVSRCSRRAVSSCAGVGSTPTDARSAPRQPRREVRRCRSRARRRRGRPRRRGRSAATRASPMTPQVISSCAHARSAAASVYSAFCCVQYATFCPT